MDQFFGWVLVVAAVLHAGGSIVGYGSDPETLVWALAGSLAALMVAAVNLIRARPPADRALALLSLAGAVVWAAVAVAFGAVIGNVLDPRAMIHAIAAVVLSGFSIHTLLALRQDAQPVRPRTAGL